MVKCYYIKWGFESRLKQTQVIDETPQDYIKWGFESRLKHQGFFEYQIPILYQMGI